TTHINNKPPRNTNITAFIRDLDRGRFSAAAALGKAQYLLTERSREYDPANAKDSDIGRRFPADVPVDWFDPEYFNKLPKSLRAKYRNKGIGLPFPDHWAADDWKRLSDTDFMEKYGKHVLALYRIPTEEEMENVAEDDADME
ncbi:hypothetical protein B0H15DRAFT_738188, partial [Mycena belliarum]